MERGIWGHLQVRTLSYDASDEDVIGAIDALLCGGDADERDVFMKWLSRIRRTSFPFLKASLITLHNRCNGDARVFIRDARVFIRDDILQDLDTAAFMEAKATKGRTEDIVGSVDAQSPKPRITKDMGVTGMSRVMHAIFARDIYVVGAERGHEQIALLIQRCCGELSWSLQGSSRDDMIEAINQCNGTFLNAQEIFLDLRRKRLDSPMTS